MDEVSNTNLSRQTSRNLSVDPSQKSRNVIRNEEVVEVKDDVVIPVPESKISVVVNNEPATDDKVAESESENKKSVAEPQMSENSPEAGNVEAPTEEEAKNPEVAENLQGDVVEEAEEAKPAEDKSANDVSNGKSSAEKNVDDVTNGEDPTTTKGPDPSGIKNHRDIPGRISKSSGKSHMSYESSTSLSSLRSESSSNSSSWDSSSSDEDDSEDEESSKSSLSFDDGEESSSSSDENRN